MTITLQLTYAELRDGTTRERYRVTFPHGAAVRVSPWFRTRRRAIMWAADFFSHR